MIGKDFMATVQEMFHHIFVDLPKESEPLPDGEWMIRKFGVSQI